MLEKLKTSALYKDLFYEILNSYNCQKVNLHFNKQGEDLHVWTKGTFRHLIT